MIETYQTTIFDMKKSAFVRLNYLFGLGNLNILEKTIALKLVGDTLVP
jgi:hypothetical protein